MFLIKSKLNINNFNTIAEEPVVLLMPLDDDYNDGPQQQITRQKRQFGFG